MEGLEDPGSAVDSGVTALLAIWAAILQQQLLPVPAESEAQNAAWFQNGNSSGREVKNPGIGEDGSLPVAGASIVAAHILGLAGGSAGLASNKASSTGSDSIQVPDACLGDAVSTVGALRSEGMEASPSELSKTLPASVLMADKNRSGHALEAVVRADSRIVSGQPQAMGQQSNSSAAIFAGPGLTWTGTSAVVSEMSSEHPAGPLPLETTVSLKRKVNERILPKTQPVELQGPSITPELEESDTKQAVASLDNPPQAEPYDKQWLAQQPEPASQAQPSPPPSTASFESIHQAESNRAVLNPGGAPAPPPATQRSRSSFAPEPPSAPPPSREAKTISIRIPLTGSNASAGTPLRHLDLVFNQRNNDLTLQFHSPNAEIQAQIEQSMPSLLDKLQTENWTSRPPELAAATAQPELGFEGRRRAETLLAAANQFESAHEPIKTANASSQEFTFDDSPADRQEAREQNESRPNQKKTRAWQDEFDEQLEP